MSTNLLLQYVVIGLAVLASALYAFRKLAPQLTNRWLAAASIRFRQPQHAAWMRALGGWMQPKQATGNCSDGCSACGACGPKPPANARVEAIPLTIRPRQR